MNKLLPLLCLSLALSACSRTEKRLEAHVFVPDAVCAHTPALNQGRTSTCWTYASASLLESDWLAGHPGDTVRLSPMYMVRQKYLNQLDAYYYSCGRKKSGMADWDILSSVCWRKTVCCRWKHIGGDGREAKGMTTGLC